MRSAYVTCPDHLDCVAVLSLLPVEEATEAPLAAPGWAEAWATVQPDFVVGSIAHVPAVRSADGVLMGSQALVESRLEAMERLTYRRHVWQFWRPRQTPKGAKT